MPIETSDNCAVLFADISGSTKLYLTAGDDRARNLVAATLDRWTAITTAAGGQVVQLRGDGMLCVFPTVDAGLGAAVAMRDMPYEPPLSMHAGLHAGAVQREAEQLYGDAVNTAARMADVAKRFEIVLTEAAQLQLTEPGRWPNLRLIPKIPVKGKPEPMNVYLLPNDKELLTDYRPPQHTKTLQLRLHLRYGPHVVVLETSGSTCLIGRDEVCGLKLDHRLVSRRHASIECVSGKFFLQDHSTNGTYVADEKHAGAVLIQRELFQLQGSGAISLGIEPSLNPEHLIRFVLAG